MGRRKGLNKDILTAWITGYPNPAPERRQSLGFKGFLCSEPSPPAMDQMLGLPLLKFPYMRHARSNKRMTRLALSAK
jgi:hypothetical protein